MTNEERDEAFGIIEEYKDIAADIEAVTESLDRLTMEKDELMNRLERLKTQELDFMTRYKEKYGDKNFLEDLNSGMIQ